jgi:hypothetical protein
VRLAVEHDVSSCQAEGLAPLALFEREDGVLVGECGLAERRGGRREEVEEVQPVERAPFREELTRRGIAERHLPQVTVQDDRRRRMFEDCAEELHAPPRRRDLFGSSSRPTARTSRHEPGHRRAGAGDEQDGKHQEDGLHADHSPRGRRSMLRPTRSIRR